MPKWEWLPIMGNRATVGILGLCVLPILLGACSVGFFDTDGANDPPKILIDTVRTGDVFTIELPVRDGDGDAIAWSASDTNFSFSKGTLSWRPARRDTGWKIVTVYADYHKGGIDSVLCSLFVVFYNHYHLVATLSDSLDLEYGTIRSSCSIRCSISGTMWNATYSEETWDNGDTPTRISWAFGYYDNGYDEERDYRQKGCELKVRIDSLKIAPDSTFIRVHQEDPCLPSSRTDDYYLSGFGLFHSNSVSGSGASSTNYYAEGESAPKFSGYVSIIDSLLNSAHD